MNLSAQVCSLELAKRLKELGVKQESLFRWQNPFNDNSWEATALKKEYIEKNNPNPENYAAFTSAEISNLLPILINRKQLNITKELDNIWVVYYEHPIYWKSNSLADALALMIFYLIDNGLMELPK